MNRDTPVYFPAFDGILKEEFETLDHQICSFGLNLQ